MAESPYRRACVVAGCPRPVHYRGRCQAHATSADAARGLNADRQRGAALYQSREWTALRRELLEACPVCQCGTGCGLPSAVVHHLRPHGGNPALFFARSNVRVLSKRCHDRITAQARGRGAAWAPGGLAKL